MTDDFLTEEEKALWKRELEGAVPLGEKTKHPVSSDTKKILRSIENPKTPMGVFPAQNTKIFSSLCHGDGRAVDRATLQRFRKGQMPITAKLDLHGYSQGQAYAALEAFIARCYQQEKRCVLVVTGKGQHSQTGEAVLQREVPRWLNEPSMRPYILMFDHAPGDKGGKGALLIILKRQRG